MISLRIIGVTSVLFFTTCHAEKSPTHFPYGVSPQGDVCVSSDYYATPETMLGSWAMIKAVSQDIESHVLPSLFTNRDVVYAVGTAAIGDKLGISNCSGGCNELNGYCFALKFNNKSNYPYMIFQSVNIGANANSFDIYMAGGGSGAFSLPCANFWGTGTSVNWGNNIENAASCDAYFNHYSTINSQYKVTYDGVVHTAKDTLMNACTYASASVTRFNTQNFDNVTVVPVTCPALLTQITGVRLSSEMKTLGTQTIHDLSTLTEEDFQQSTITRVTTTQMQDCKTPSSGYCGNVSSTVPNNNASISAGLTEPLLTGQIPNDHYCKNNPNFSGGFCTWNKGQSSGGGSYCNESEANCISCGNHAAWCICKQGQLCDCVLS